MTTEKKTVTLPITDTPADRVRIASRARVNGAELVELHAEAIGRSGMPICPRCFTLNRDGPLGSEVLLLCGSCGRYFLALEMLDLNGPPFFVCVPWSQ